MGVLSEAPGAIGSTQGTIECFELPVVEPVQKGIRQGVDLLDVELFELLWSELAECLGGEGFELFWGEVVGGEFAQLPVGHGCDELGGEFADLVWLQGFDGSGRQFAHLLSLHGVDQPGRHA